MVKRSFAERLPMNVNDYKALSYSEDDECSLLVDYLNELVKQQKIQCYSHVANETYTPYHSVKAKNKKLGVHAGVPDYVIVGFDKIMFLEMKRRKGGVISSNQQLWIDAINASGVCGCFVGYGVDAARELIATYFTI